jgi:hypothetical protein
VLSTAVITTQIQPQIAQYQFNSSTKGEICYLLHILQDICLNSDGLWEVSGAERTVAVKTVAEWTTKNMTVTGLSLLKCSKNTCCFYVSYSSYTEHI